ncbi:MAG: hypothetical protein M9924_20565 [Rhizobiaceae bacterium]|nr:hypothetical protein [Rhizobiaceae bacterium]
MSEAPIRLPAAATVDTVLAGLDPASADAELAPALSRTFPGFVFSTAPIDDFYWRVDTRTVIEAGGVRLGEHEAWVKNELAAAGGDLAAFWQRHRDSGKQFAEWRGRAVFAFAPTGPGVADFIQLLLGREIEVLAGAIVDPGYRPRSIDDLLEPSWIKREPVSDAPVLAGPAYRLQRRSGFVHVRSFLATRRRREREQRETRRPELEAHADRPPAAAASQSSTPIPPGFFVFVPRENRFFADWERSSASAARIFEHWAFDISDYEEHSQRQLSFIPRPLKMPAERLVPDEGVSVHRLMERIEAIDDAVGLPFGWFFLMTHGHWVDPDVGDAIAEGLRAGRVRLPDRDAAVLLGWAAQKYLF